MVRLPLRIVMSAVSTIAPDTSNMQVRGPVASMQAFSEPVPLALRLVTRWTAPPRPAGVLIPKPAAPGITGTACAVLNAKDPSNTHTELLDTFTTTDSWNARSCVWTGVGRAVTGLEDARSNLLGARLSPAGDSGHFQGVSLASGNPPPHLNVTRARSSGASEVSPRSPQPVRQEFAARFGAPRGERATP